MLRCAEVYQYSLALLVEHDVARLDVEMQTIETMNIFQSLCHLTYISNRLSFGQLAAFLHHVTKRLSLDILHGIVCSAVFLEDIYHSDNTRMLHLKQSTGLVHELLLQLTDKLFLGFCGYSHLSSCFITVAEVTNKELLQRNT